jgi:hypothetical protein
MVCSLKRGFSSAFARPRAGVVLLLVGGLLLAATACDDRSPTEPTASRLTIVIADPAGSFAPHHEAIRRLLEQTVERARTALAVPSLTITVSADPPSTIPGWGIGGYALDGSGIDIVLDPAYPGLGAVLGERLPPIAAHEIHHVVRWHVPGYGVTLLEVMVSEGLADRFAIELLGSPVPPWSQAFPESETAHYLDLARPELDSASFDRGAWLFGTSPRLPRWTGYTLGYRLVEAYQARSGRSAAQLVHTPASVFRPD